MRKTAKRQEPITNYSSKYSYAKTIVRKVDRNIQKFHRELIRER